MTTKERIIEQLERMDEAKLVALEEQLREANVSDGDEERARAQLEALNELAGLLSDPEEYAEWEKHARRRSLFGGRALDLEPDETG